MAICLYQAFMSSEPPSQPLKGLLQLSDGKHPEVKGLVLRPEGQ